MKSTAIFETDDIQIYDEPSREYLDWLAESNAFFDSPRWGKILEMGFGVDRFYLWDRGQHLGHALSIFRKGPFTMGYLGFPVCAGVNSGTDSPYKLDRMVAAICAMPRKPQVLRVPISAFGQRILSSQRQTTRTVETCITDLPQWRPDATADRRRASHRAQRRCSELRRCGLASGEEMFALYKQAIRRNSGRTRYTINYFHALANELQTGSVQLAGLAASSALASMVLTACHGQSTYYLHSGSLPESLKLGGSDLTMQHAIQSAQISGYKHFNFMSSPPDQHGLIRFKEKWGGATHIADTITTPISFPGRVLVKLKR